MEQMEQIGSWIGYGLAAVFVIWFVYQDIQCRRKGALSTRSNPKRYSYTIAIQLSKGKEVIQLYSEWDYSNLEALLSRYRRKENGERYLSFPISEKERRIIRESAIEQIHIRKIDTKEESML